MRLLRAQSVPVVSEVERRPQPREGALGSVHLLPGTRLPPTPCLCPWQPNSATPTPHHHPPSRLHPLLKEAQLSLLWGGQCRILTTNLSTSPRPGGQSQFPLPPLIRNIPDTSAWPASNFQRKKQQLQLWARPGQPETSVFILPLAGAPSPTSRQPREDTGCAADPTGQPVIKQCPDD